MGRCYTLLILSALLVSSMSAPAPSDTGGEENGQDLIQVLAILLNSTV